MYCKKSIPFISLQWLHELGRSIIIRDVEPQAMRHCGRDTFPETKRISTDEVSTLAIGIIQGIEEVWCSRAQKVLDVLLKCIDILA